MKLLKELVQIDKKFQNSVNLTLDLEQDAKLNSYIPTRSSVAVLQEYISAVLGKKPARATILIGPYGKGKSHLLLVLLRLLSEKKISVLNKIISKIEKTDADTANMIRQMKKEKKQFLPVILTGADSSLADSFRFGLTEALRRARLTDIMPDSYYSEAAACIKRWEKEYPDTLQAFEEKLTAKGMTKKQLFSALHHMEEKSLQIFREIYPQVTAGSIFSPMVQLDIMKIYEQVNHLLCEKYHYTGMFLVFDEFSKYVEGHGQQGFAADMKILQDMCELAAHSGREQLHIVFVAHKSIKEYGSRLSKNMQDIFTGVEGRLTEVPFVVSGKNNYELVGSVITKKNEEYRKVMRQDIEWKKLLDTSYEIPCMNGLFEIDEYKKVMQESCFPLLPMTTYLLLAISEKVAQNERSVFTFLANDEKGSLVHMIEREDEPAHGIAADVIYDYFRSLFKENTALTRIHSEWLKAEYALQKAEKDDEKQVIKVFALLKMIDNAEEVPVSDKTIWLASGLSQGRTEEIMKELVKKQIVVWREKFATYSFKNNIGIDLEKEIRTVVKKMSGQLNVCQLLQQVSDLEYVLPKRHNQEYTMTRYFHYMYMEEEQFFSLKKSEYLFEEHIADGKIVAIVGEDADKQAVSERLRELSDSRIVVLLPKEGLRQQENLERLAAVRTLKHDTGFIEQNQVLAQELDIYEEDLVFEINAALERLYLPEKGHCYVLHGNQISDEWHHAMEFNRMLSDICEEYYDHTPRVNNEQINRRVLTAQTKRARNQLVEAILTERPLEVYEEGTSPEATIFRATMLHTGILDDSQPMDEGSSYVLKCISHFIAASADKRQSFGQLYEKLLGEGCGARNGIIPIYIARQISRLEDTPVILLRDKEVVISADILNNIDENPMEYYLYVEQQSVDKAAYLKYLEEIFAVTKGNGQSGVTKLARLQRLMEAMQRWYRSLPQTAVTFRQCPDDMTPQEFEQLQSLRGLFQKIEMNPHEVIFEQIPAIYATKSSILCAQSLERQKKYLEGYLGSVKQAAIHVTKEIFGAKAEDGLFSVLTMWYEEQSEAAKQFLANSRVTSFMSYLNRIHTHEESEIAGRLAKYVMDLYIEDWRDDSLERYRTELCAVKQQVETMQEEVSHTSNRKVISYIDSTGERVEKYYDSVGDDSTSYFLKNAMQQALDEFGDTLEVNQKVAVLVQMLEKLTK